MVRFKIINSINEIIPERQLDQNKDKKNTKNKHDNYVKEDHYYLGPYRVCEEILFYGVGCEHVLLPCDEYCDGVSPGCDEVSCDSVECPGFDTDDP